MARFTQGGGSGEGSALNYVQVAASPVTVSSANTAFASLELTTTGKPVQVSVTGEAANANAGSWVRINLFRNGTAIGNEMQVESSAVSENVPYAINFIDDVAAGTHTYEAKVTTKSAGNWVFGEAGGAVINAVELTGFKGDQGLRGLQGEPGADGSSANVGDFVFNDSTASTNSDMQLTVNGVPGKVTLSAYNGVELEFAEASGSGLKFPDGSIQTTAFTEQSYDPLPDFLTFTQGREALPLLNSNFGWNSTGLWFGPTAVDAQSNASYPVFTNFTLNQTDKVFVTFKVNINENCSDAGICVYLDGQTPNWTWGTDQTRIAAQFNCPSMEIHGINGSSTGSPSVPEPGIYRIEFTYSPASESEQVLFEYFTENGSTAIGSRTLSETLPSGNYRIGFASDNDPGDALEGPGNADAPGNKTYISDLNIIINDGQTTYSNLLTSGYSGNYVGLTELVVPLAIKDTSGNDLISFTKTNVGTARIETLQDDLSLRSARDITLYPGSDGPGNVYIGWGNASTNANPQNRVATIGDLDNGPKTWNINGSDYVIRQAHGGIEVQLPQPQTWSENVTVTGTFTNTNAMNIAVSPELSAIFLDIYNNVKYFRRISIDLGAETRYFYLNSPVDTNVWSIYTQVGNFSASDSNQYYLQLEYDGAPVEWWNPDNLELVPSGDEWKFRGAKIEYHAYSTDSGTMIGTIYIAHDSGSNNVTHIETNSGANDNGNVVLWKRIFGNYENERKLYAYRVDNEDDTVRIHWTAQVYYGTEYYGD